MLLSSRLVLSNYRGLNVSHWVYNKMFLTAHSSPLEKGMAQQDYQHVALGLYIILQGLPIPQLQLRELQHSSCILWQLTIDWP